MKKLIFILILCLVLNCKSEGQKNDCHKKFKKYNSSLLYLKDYLKNERDTSYLVNDITENIEVLETISGIKSEIGGELLGKFRVLPKDIKKWEKWLEDECKNISDNSN